MYRYTCTDIIQNSFNKVYGMSSTNVHTHTQTSFVSYASRGSATASFSSWQGVDVFRYDLLIMLSTLVYPLCSVKKQ